MKIIDFLQKMGIIFVVLLFISNGCSDSNKINFESVEIINFDSSKSKGRWTYDFKQMLDSTLSIVPLETNEDCLISKIDKIEIKNGNIFIKDDLAKSVYVFDLKGKYKGKVNAVGAGPGEYVTLSYMTVTDSSIVVLDHDIGKQIEYRISDFKVLRTEPLFSKIWATQLFSLPECLYYINDWSTSRSGKYRLFLHKNGSNSFEKFLPFDKQPVALGINGPEYAVNGDSALIIYSGDDYIYRVKNNEVSPRYKVVFKDKRIEYPSGITRNVLEENPPGRIFGVSSINESDKFIFLYISTNGDYDFTCIFDKSNGQTTIYSSSFIVSYFDDSDNFALRRVIDNKIICSLPADNFFQNKDYYLQKKYKNEEYRRLFIEFIENIKEDDNPVLFIFSLKK